MRDPGAQRRNRGDRRCVYVSGHHARCWCPVPRGHRTSRPRTLLSAAAAATTTVLVAVGLGTAALAAPGPAVPETPIVRGPILQHYLAIDDAGYDLGQPVTSEAPTPYRPGLFNVFEQGAIYWSPTTGAWSVRGLVQQDWSELGHENSVLGFPTSDELPIGNDGAALYETFEGGIVYYVRGDLRAHEVHGDVLREYASLGYERSVLGFPVEDESPAPDGVGRYQLFQGGSVYWSPTTGAHAVRGAVLRKWRSVGYELSVLGYPTSDEHVVTGGGRASDFQYGTITWTPQHGAVVSSGQGAVSSIDRRGSSFSMSVLQQSFHVDDGDTFQLQEPGGGAPVPLTRAAFLRSLVPGSPVVVRGYAPERRVHVTYELEK